MLRRSFSIILMLMLVSGLMRAQIPGIDTIFKASELFYFSELERRAFSDLLDGKPDYLAMIASINPNTDGRELGLYRDWLDDIIEVITVKKFDELNEEKKIERINKYVSKALLINYSNKANFDDLFRFGDFNYFTAASIYAFLLEKLDIPYEIYELPTHIYLLAYPGNQRIKLETTKPGYQYFMFDHETRENFVDYLHEQDVINDRVYTNTNTKDIFQQYYFANYGLSIREMIGMLYINSAVGLIMEEKTSEAYSQLEKALILHPSYKSQYMLLLELNRYLTTLDYHNPIRLGYLIKASRLIDYGIDREYIENYLSDIVNKVLIEDEDPDGFLYIYNYLMEYLSDEDLKNGFKFHYLYESGRIEFNDSRYGKALDFLEPAHLLNPEEKRTRDLLARSLAGYSLLVSPGLVLQKIRLYDTSYTAITKEGIYLVVKSQSLLAIFGQAFQLRDRDTGESYMEEFEQLLKSNPEIEIDNMLIGRSYSSAAIFYYRNGQTSKSKQILEKGLSYAPDNIELKLKLNSFQ